MLQFDDEATNLVTKKINIFLYKNEEGYFRVLNRIAPIVQEGEILSYNENDFNPKDGESVEKRSYAGCPRKCGQVQQASAAEGDDFDDLGSSNLDDFDF